MYAFSHRFSKRLPAMRKSLEFVRVNFTTARIYYLPLISNSSIVLLHVARYKEWCPKLRM